MGKSSNQVAGYRFKLRNHAGLTYGPIDAYLEHRGGDKVAWSGRQTVSGTIAINAPKLWGGDKDQGGIVGNLYVMMGEADQAPNAMLVSAFGDQTGAWRGFATVAFDGIYGSNNPYPQPQSHKVEKILKGWDGDAPWYPSKARIPMGGASIAPSAWLSGFSISLIGADIAVTDTVAGDNQFTPELADQYGHTYDPISPSSSWLYFWRSNESGLLYSKREEDTINNSDMVPILIDRGLQLDQTCLVRYWNVGAGLHMTVLTAGATSDPPPAPEGYSWVEGDDSPLAGTAYGTVRLWQSSAFVEGASTLFCVNPAHALYYLRTQSHKGGEPTANIDATSFTAAADRLFAEGFGICLRHDPDQESVEDIENRICKLIGGSVNRSPIDGKLHLDLARGDYVLEDLPIVGDDDILDFSELPTTPEGSVNSVSVRYFDPQRKETIITPSVDALGLIDEFGLNHQVIDYPEIPIASLASRIATRELLQFITPSRAFDMVCKPSVYALQPNQYFRLQTPKRGIEGMVCIVGEKGGGTLKSGAIRLQSAQVADTLPEFGSVDVETGVDTNPPTVPTAITEQVAFEAPYINVCTAFSAADLAALQPEAGFLIAAAEDPDTSRDFTLMVDAGAGYVEQGDGDWCPTLVINEAALLEDPLPVDFTFSAGKRLSDVAVGDVALWGSEICRLDALDIDAGTLTLGRACADTVPQEHVAGERVWFYAEGSAHDSTEYSDGETVSAKLLTNTFSEQLPISSATPIDVTFAARQVRPYPPGLVRLGGIARPTAITGDIVVTWVHRDRVLQADQLLDHEAASVGPEATVRYALQFFDDADALIVEKLDIDGTTATAALSTTGDVRMVLYAVSDLGDSWQVHERTFAYTSAGGTDTIDAETYAPDEIIIDGGGD